MLKKNLAVLGLGSNLGRRAENLAKALGCISGFCSVERLSSVYVTESLLKDDQQDYFNMCALVSTDFTETELLYALKNVELVMGREPSGRWQTRVIDIDIIDFNNSVFSDERLNIPHQEMANRSFVLYPLREIYPGYKNPVSCQSIDDMIKNLKDDLGIKRLGRCIWR